jgi:hypothetical protein
MPGRHSLLDHRERGWVRGGFGAADLSEDPFDLGHGGDDPVGLLQEFPGLRDRDSGKCRRHVEKVALVQGRHELGANLLQGVEARAQEKERDCEHGKAMSKCTRERGAIDKVHGAVQRVLVLGEDPPPYEPEHEHWNDGDGEQRGARHGVGLGEGKGFEEPALLGFQGEDGQERDGDDEQGEEE